MEEGIFIGTYEEVINLVTELGDEYDFEEYGTSWSLGQLWRVFKIED